MSFACGSFAEGKGRGGIPLAGSAPGRTGVIIPLALTHCLQRNRSLLIDCFPHFQGTVGFSFIAPSDNMSRILYYPHTAVKFSKHKRLICKNERHLHKHNFSVEGLKIQILGRKVFSAGHVSRCPEIWNSYIRPCFWTPSTFPWLQCSR